jgi:hypothetical protein
MTTPHDLYIEATRRGLRLEPAGDKLAVYPRGQCPPDFADTLRQHKGELLDWLSRPPCPGWQAVPPPDLPLRTLPPRPTPASNQAVIAYLLRQTGDRPGPLAAWLVRRQNSYYAGPGRHWDCGLICYAAARDAVCWQLGRSESEVWQFLEATAETYQHK